MKVNNKNITELNDSEMLNFLLSVDFNENISFDDLVYIFNNYKQFLRWQLDRNENLHNEISKLKHQSEQMVKSNDYINLNYIVKINQLEQELFLLRNRRLSFKERLKGKIDLTLKPKFGIDKEI
jgi:hypothetical protein